MTGQPKRGWLARRRAATAAVCSVVFAVVGGVLLATPANAGILGATDACTTPTALVDTTGAGTGTLDLSGSTSGVTLGADCITSVTLGDAPAQSNATTPARPVSRAQTPTTGGTSTDTGTAAAATDPTTGATTPAPTPVAASGATSPVSAAVASTTTRLASLSVIRSSNTVYPVKDGYRDSVKFAVHAMNASGSLIPVVGTAVLSKAGKTIETWHIDSSTTVISWNGRVGRTIKAGLYTLTVSAWSPDGTTQTERSLVRVLTQHLVRHVMTVRTNVGAKSVSADLPKQLLKAYRTGTISCRIRTVASVHGTARLVFGNNGVTRSIVLKNGTHTSERRVVPQGFEHVTITHDWAKGAAHLTSLKAIWTYSTLS